MRLVLNFGQSIKNYFFDTFKRFRSFKLYNTLNNLIKIDDL